MTFTSRTRIIHNCKITFTGVNSFILPLQMFLCKELNLYCSKLNYTNAKNPNKSTSSNVCTLEWSGRNNIKKLFHYMYDNSSIYGEIKYNKFLNIICASVKKLTEDTSLTAGTPEMVISNQASKEEGSTTIPEMGVESSDSKCEALNR